MMPLSPASIFLVAGTMLGPGVLDVLSDELLAAVDPMIFAGLTTMGVLVGLEARFGVRTAAALMLGVAIAARTHTPSSTAMTLTAFTIAAAAIAVAAWLLVDDTSESSEQHVFTLGAVLLLSGAAAYLSLSAIFGGLVAGVLWQRAGGYGRERIERDVRYLQRPVIVMVLVVAGARFQLQDIELPLVCLCVGIAASVFVRHNLAPAIAPTTLAIAAALDVSRAWSPSSTAAATVLAAAVMLSFGWDAVASFRKLPEAAAA